MVRLSSDQGNGARRCRECAVRRLAWFRGEWKRRFRQSGQQEGAGDHRRGRRLDSCHVRFVRRHLRWLRRCEEGDAQHGDDDHDGHLDGGKYGGKYSDRHALGDTGCANVISPRRGRRPHDDAAGDDDTARAGSDSDDYRREPDDDRQRVRLLLELCSGACRGSCTTTPGRARLPVRTRSRWRRRRLRQLTTIIPDRRTACPTR